jgi:hypothetical protein
MISSVAIASNTDSYVDINGTHASIKDFSHDGNGLSISIVSPFLKEFHLRYGFSYHTGNYHDNGYSYDIANEIVYFQNLSPSSYKMMIGDYKSLSLQISFGYEHKIHDSFGVWAEAGASAIHFQRKFLKTIANCTGDYIVSCYTTSKYHTEKERGLGLITSIGASYYIGSDIAIIASGAYNHYNFNVDKNKFNTTIVSVGIRRSF